MDDFSRRQASIKGVLTCGICNKLCKDVTIIEECCHRFCKKCITRKITEEKLKFCPECNLDLGAAPLQKIRPDHHVQGIKDIISAKRRELIESGLLENKPKKTETKKLAHENIDINSSPNMLIDSPPSPPPPPAVATSSRRKEKSISSIVNTAPPVVDDHEHAPIQHVIVGRRGRRRGSRNNNTNANVAARFQDSSKFNFVVDLNKGDPQAGSSTIPLLSSKATQNKQQIKGDQSGNSSSSTPLLSGKATQHKQQVESSANAAESSKNDRISKKNRSVKPLDGMNDLWEPLHKLVTKGVTLDLNSNKSKFKEPVPKFTTPIPINLDDDEDENGDDDEEDEEYVPTRKIKEHKVGKQNVVQKPNVIVPPPSPTPPTPAPVPTPSSSTNDKGKGKNKRHGRKKKETNNPIPPPPPSPPRADADESNINVPQVQVTNEAAAAAATSSGSTGVLNERVHPIWFTLVASDNQKCSSPLPQIPNRFIKIKDVNMPSSYIMKYLAKTLNLQSEDEVEVRLLGMPIRPNLPLHHLADLWLHAAPTAEKTVKVGASAEEFVMVLRYGRSPN
ncbi:putative E3 ubiquitin protein ligase DRIPH isoform X1 [Capsicum annuum]